MPTCEYCGKNHKGNHKYCKECLDALCNEEYTEEEIDNLVVCTVCGGLSHTRTCKACREALKTEKEWMKENNVR